MSAPVAKDAGTAPAGPAGRRPRPAASPRSAPRQAETDPLALVRAFVALYLEVEAGRRPRGQLARMMSPVLFERLRPVWVRGGEPATLEALEGRWTTRTRYEAVAVIGRGRRRSALAVSLRRLGASWRVEDAVRPEDGPLPPAPWEDELAADAAQGLASLAVDAIGTGLGS